MFRETLPPRLISMAPSENFAHIYLTFCLYTNADANINTLTTIYMHIHPSGGIVDCLEYLGKNI